MKKCLVILLSFFILINLHCARFNVQTVDKSQRISSCQATLLNATEKSLSKKSGTLVLSEDAIIFLHKNDQKKIPYAQIDSFDIRQLPANTSPRPAAPSFAQEGRSIMDGAGLTTAIVIGFFAVALLLWLFFGMGSKHRSSVQIDFYFTSDNTKEMAAFKMTREGFAKIYPLLVEKIH